MPPATAASRSLFPVPTRLPGTSSGPWRRCARPALLAILAGLALLPSTAPPAWAQAAARGFSVAITGFDDVNGNGKLDCGEPVTVEAGYFDAPQDSTAAITGHLTAPFSGTSG